MPDNEMPEDEMPDEELADDGGTRFARAVGAPAEAALTRLFELTDLVTPMAIRVAATWRLADLIASGTDRPAELAARAGADPAAMHRLLRHLVAHGLLAEPEPGRYALTRLSAPLQEGHPAGLRDWLDLSGAMGRSDMAFAYLLDSVRTGQPSYASMFGQPYWDNLNAHPALRASFDALMAAQLAGAGAEIVAAYDWASVSAVVDVGGGDGTQLAQILAACPPVRGTLVEQPATAAAARRNLAGRGLSDRCEVIEGSFFDPLPPGRDVYLLSGVLHDWDDQHAGQILARCAQAAGPGGHVVISERQAEEAATSAMATALDLRMLVTLGGRERTVEEYRSLAATAGLAIAEIIPVGHRQLIDCAAR
jgi:precorrin-6B methylase 2